MELVLVGTVCTRWAILIAGSNGYWNYRHQADICHAYQLLKQGGLKDEILLYLCMMILLLMLTPLGKESSLTVLMLMMFIKEFQRITPGIKLQFITSLLQSLGTKALLPGVVGKLWTVVRMIISSYTILIMVFLEYLRSMQQYNKVELSALGMASHRLRMLEGRVVLRFSKQGNGPNVFRFNPRNANDIFAEIFGFSSPLGGGMGGGGSGMRGGRSFGGMFGGDDIFSLFGEGRPMSQGTRKAAPLERKLPCCLEELYKGTTKKMKISREIADASGHCIRSRWLLLAYHVLVGWEVRWLILLILQDLLEGEACASCLRSWKV